MMGRVKSFLLSLGIALVAFGGVAGAVPIETYNLDQGIGGNNVTTGTVTVTQISLGQVSVDVEINPNLFINTGGPHTPFAFNLTSALATALNAAGGSAVTVTAPTTTAACAPASTPCFTPDYASGSATPFGSLNEAFTYNAGNGSSKGNPGPLQFTITLPNIGAINTTTQQFTAFVVNGGSAIFAGDLSISGGSTGTEIAPSGVCIGCGATINQNGGDTVPEPASIAVLGAALTGLSMIRRRRRS